MVCLRKEEGVGGTALRNEEGESVRIAHGMSPFKTLDLIELDALDQGINQAVKYGFSKAMIDIDSSVVMHYMRMDNPPWIVKSKVKRNRSAMESLNSCTIEHCYREANSLADAIADIDTDRRVEDLDVAKLSNKCNVIIENDKIGKLY